MPPSTERLQQIALMYAADNGTTNASPTAPIPGDYFREH
jgi:hypothetical protein